MESGRGHFEPSWIAPLILKDCQEFAIRFKVRVVSSDFEKLFG